jgi:hypothetical protein
LAIKAKYQLTRPSSHDRLPRYAVLPAAYGHVRRIKMKKIIILAFLLFPTFCTTPPPKTGWDRYQLVDFKKLIDKYNGYILMEHENTIRIFSPQNALLGYFNYLGKSEIISESELMVIQGHLGNEDKEILRKTYVHKSLLESNGTKAWFCFQEAIYSDLLNLKLNEEIMVYYQFVGSTNAGSEPHFLFIVTAWKSK